MENHTTSPQQSWNDVFVSVFTGISKGEASLRMHFCDTQMSSMQEAVSYSKHEIKLFDLESDSGMSEGQWIAYKSRFNLPKTLNDSLNTAVRNTKVEVRKLRRGKQPELPSSDYEAKIRTICDKAIATVLEALESFKVEGNYAFVSQLDAKERAACLATEFKRKLDKHKGLVFRPVNTDTTEKTDLKGGEEGTKKAIDLMFQVAEHSIDKQYDYGRYHTGFMPQAGLEELLQNTWRILGNDSFQQVDFESLAAQKGFEEGVSKLRTKIDDLNNLYNSCDEGNFSDGMPSTWHGSIGRGKNYWERP